VVIVATQLRWVAAAIIKRRENNDYDPIPKKAGSMTKRTEQVKGREALHRALPSAQD
jgi:hypothetical protein